MAIRDNFSYNDMDEWLNGKRVTEIECLVPDLTGVARVIIARTFSPYELFITIGLVYLALTYLTLWGFRRVEAHLYRHLRSRRDVVSDVPLLR